MKCSRHPSGGLIFEYYIEAWFFERQFTKTELDSASKLHIEPWRCSIGWTLHGSTRDSDNPTWTTMDHFSTLPHAAIPRDGIEFFEQLLDQLLTKWRKLCEDDQGRLMLLVRETLFYRICTRTDSADTQSAQDYPK